MFWFLSENMCQDLKIVSTFLSPMVAKTKHILGYFERCYENQMEERVDHKLVHMASVDNTRVVETLAGMATDTQTLEDKNPHYRQLPGGDLALRTAI